MLDNEAKKLFEMQKTWFLATCGDELNLVAIGLTAVLDDGRLALGDTGMVTSVANIQKNGMAAVAAYTENPMCGYQVKGKATYDAGGPIVEACQAMADGAFGAGKITVQGVVLVTPEKCINLLG